ncbi:MAG: alanine racemase [bacterium]|nr:alanine racemase [bacterium]
MDRANLKTWIEVSKATLENNVRVIRRLSQGKIIMAVVKSNAYGHGLVETAKLFLKYGADWIGTDNLNEAVALRKAKVKAPILVLGYTPVEALALAVKNKIKLTLYGEEFFKTASPHKRHIDWHLKIDSGMSRQGVLSEDLPVFIQNLKNFPDIKLEGVFTHFANADDIPRLAYARTQLANFHGALAVLEANGINPKIIHAAATPAFFSLPEASFDLIRVGIGFYGLWPSDKFQESFGGFGLEPALSWKTRVVQVKKIKKGTPVGYGITEKVRRDSTIAVLPVGYYDGFFRGLSSIGRVLIHEQSCKILGRVSMNLCVADVSAVSAVKVWDEAVLIGQSGEEKITPEEIAQKLGTISYEVVSRINPLLPRIYL